MNKKENNFIGKTFKHDAQYLFETDGTEDSDFLYKHHLPGDKHRILRPHSIITMDFDPNRFNIVLNHEDKVKRTYWG